MIEEFRHDGVLYALIIRRDFHRPGVHFVTPGDFSQQLAYMARPAGELIQPHYHRDVQRDVHRTQEVLLLRKGRLRVDFYRAGEERIGSRVLEAGDVILLSEGGHGFEVLEDCEMFEVKQGPYLGDGDKVRFDPAAEPAA
jgi:mannose-6-phosphate isomerase-like protein (cupin superfamily)